jgi:membrane protease YdiL (CAAX protease family)
MNPTLRVALYFVVTFAVSWACQTPGILVLREHLEPPAVLMLMMAVGSMGPSLVALGFGALEGRAPARPARQYSPRMPLWQVSLIALAFPAAAHLFGSVILYIVGAYRAEHLVYPPLRPEQIAIAIVAPLGEEFGWRGYALPRLQASASPLVASLWIGLVWALWHIPTFFVPEARGTTTFELCLYLVAFLASSVIYTWLFNVGGGSIRGPLLAHLGIHLDNVFRASTMGDGVAPLAMTTLVLVLMAAGLVLRGRLSREDAVVFVQPSAARPVTSLG